MSNFFDEKNNTFSPESEIECLLLCICILIQGQIWFIALSYNKLLSSCLAITWISRQKKRLSLKPKIWFLYSDAATAKQQMALNFELVLSDQF